MKYICCNNFMVQVCDSISDCPTGEAAVGGEDENECDLGSGFGHPDGGDLITSLDFGEFSVLQLEEVDEGRYLLKTGGFLKALIFFSFKQFNNLTRSDHPSAPQECHCCVGGL